MSHYLEELEIQWYYEIDIEDKTHKYYEYWMKVMEEAFDFDHENKK
jgi:hypothetical protein